MTTALKASQNDMTMVLKAIRFATIKHQGQYRKVSGKEYVTHVIAVSYIVAAFKSSKYFVALICAAILHDILEDTDTTFIELATEFSPMIASIVLELTNDEVQITLLGKLEYQKKKLVGMSSYALVIKLADRLNNISDNPTLKMINETIELMDHLRKNRKLTNTQKALMADIYAECQKALQKL